MENNQMLRLMTFNIRHGQGMDDCVDLARIISELIQGKADIIALQEVDRWNIRSGLLDQLARMKKAMRMDGRFSSSLYIGFAQYGNAILSRLPIHRSETFFLPGQRERRSVLHVQIQVNDGPMLHILSTHLGVYASERKVQIPLLREMMDSIKEPAFVMGDFNMQYKNPLMQELLKGWSKIQITGKKQTVAGGMEIDHILTNLPCDHIKAWTQPTLASDHYPVLADIPYDMLHLT